MKSDAMTLREALGFQLLLDGCKHEVMIAANVGTWERPCVWFLMPDLKRWVVIMKSIWLSTCPIRAMPGCCPRQLVGVESVGKGESVAVCKHQEFSFPVVCLSSSESSYFLRSSVGMRPGILRHSNSF